MAGNQTRERILAVTREIIRSRGLQAVTLREVGQRAGVSRSAAYRHFLDKDDLLAQVVLDDFEDLKSRFARATTSTGNKKNKLESLMALLYEYGRENREQYQLMFSREWKGRSGERISESALGLFYAAEGIIAGMLGADRESETVRRATSVSISFMHGLISLHNSGHTEAIKGLDDAKKLIRAYIAMALSGRGK